MIALSRWINSEIGETRVEASLYPWFANLPWSRVWILLAPCGLLIDAIFAIAGHVSLPLLFLFGSLWLITIFVDGLMHYCYLSAAQTLYENGTLPYREGFEIGRQ